MNTLTAALAAFATTIGLGMVHRSAVEWSSLDNSVCAAAPEYAGPDCGSPGDDNHDGWIMEDEQGWDCQTMGNHVCGRLTVNNR